jgi:protocatechuate 3,4-dioxygenase beta subunit
MFTSANSLKKTSICIAFLLVLIGFASSFSYAAGSISGMVTGPANVTVTAYDSNWNSVASAITDSSGNYTITGLAAASYYIHTTNTLGYIDKFYNTSSGGWYRGAATAVTVTESSDTPNINLSLSSGAGSISGRVTRTSDNTGMQNVTVIVYFALDWSPLYVAWGNTDSSGNYSIPGLQPFITYYVKTANSYGYVNKYYDNAEVTGAATAISVSRADINFSLALGGSISGRVTRASDGAGIPSVRVDAFRPINYNNTTYALTDSDGYYTITGLAAGYYDVSENTGSDDYVDHFLSSNIDIIAIPVALGTNTPNVNFSLITGGSISGRVVRDSDGTGIQNALMAVQDDENNLYSVAQTDSAGYYTAKGIPTGYYYVQVLLVADYRPEYYNNSVSRKTATTVPVIQGSTTPDINFSLIAVTAPAKGSISGQVTRVSDGAVQPNVSVRAYPVNSTSSYTSASTDSSGNYSITGLAPGDYYVTTYCNPFYTHGDMYYSGAISRGSATQVTISAGANSPNINFSLSPGGQISGRIIRNSDGAGIYSATINVYDTNGFFVKSVTANASGNYTIPGLVPGDYFVATNRLNGYIDEFYNDVLSLGAATAVTVTAGTTSSGIDLALDSGFTISGNVNRKHDGTAIAGVQVNVYNSSRALVASTNTDSSGAYYIEGFAPGDYYVQVTNAPGYIGEYYYNANSLDTALPVHIYNDITYSGANAGFGLTPTAVVAADFNRDRKADITVWRPGSSVWYTLPSGSSDYTATWWGLPSDAPVLGDYDGDGEADVAVWRSDSGVWYTLPSGSPGTYTSILWGMSGDVPVAGDYDGDGKTDVAVWRPSDGIWYALPSASPGTYTFISWGMSGDVPVPADYDGDGKIDVAVWRPDTGVWYILPSQSPGTYLGVTWGMNTDKPVPADYDRDGKADIAVWRPSDGVWYALPSSNPGTYTSTAWGLTSDIPAPGDYDGDGKTDIAVWRPSDGVWYVLLSGSPGSYLSIAWGMNGDQPVSSATGILKALP